MHSVKNYIHHLGHVYCLGTRRSFLTRRLHSLRTPYRRKRLENFLQIHKGSSCSQAKTNLHSVSILAPRSERQHGGAFRRRRLTRKRVCLNSAASACRTKRWIPAPDQRSRQEKHKFHPAKVFQGQDGVHDGKPGRPCNVTDDSCWNPGNQEAFEYGASVRSNRHYQTTSFYVYHSIGLGMQRCEYQPPMM